MEACGRLAARAGVRNLMVTHFSPKYRDTPGLLIQEAGAAFKGNQS